MKQLFTFLLFALLLTSCGSTQTQATQNTSAEGYTLYENLDVLAFYQNMPRGMFIRTLSGPRGVYKVTTPLEDGKKYRVTIRVPNNSSSTIKEAKIIAHTML